MTLQIMKYYWRPIVGMIIILVLLVLSITNTVQTYETAKVTAYEELDKNWRTGYDLLVSLNATNNDEIPSNTQHALIQRSGMSQQRGGISLEQYEQIKQIEGVQVAAPISFIGYIAAEDMHFNYQLIDEGFYYTENTIRVFDGLKYRSIGGKSELLFQYSKTETGPSMRNLENYNKYIREGGWEIFNTGDRFISPRMGYNWTFIAVDPVEEKKLLSIDDAIIDGQYLPEKQYLDKNEKTTFIPLILLNQSYQTVATSNLYRVEIDPNLSNEQIKELGGSAYLDSLPRTLMDSIEFNPYNEEFLYYYGELKFLNGQLLKEERGIYTFSNSYRMFEISPIELHSREDYNGYPFFEAIPIKADGEILLYCSKDIPPRC